MCDKSINSYHSIMQFVCDCYKTQEMCDKAVNKCFHAFIYILDQYKSQMYGRVISEYSFLIF